VPSSPWKLWVTRQALADIGYEDLAGPGFDLDALSMRHPILDTFKTKRTSNPRGTEQTQGVKGEIFNLHARNPYEGLRILMKQGASSSSWRYR